jgi:hypothetical protein
MKEIVSDKKLIAYCGLYCGACRSYLKEKCPGCKENEKATWCNIRKCCIDNKYSTCADCASIETKKSKNYNTFISKIVGLLFNSDRNACLDRIKNVGYDEFAKEMALNKRQTIKKKQA